MKAMTMAALLWVASAVSTVADYNSEALDRFVRHAEANIVTSSGYWFEMFNALGEWEKTMLIFGYADPGDYAACQRVKVAAEADRPGTLFRCSPVQ